MSLRARGALRRRGFTLVELTIALAIFAVVGTMLSAGVTLGHGAHDAVRVAARENRAVRATVDALVRDLKASTDARVTAVAQADGNGQLTLQLPIEVDGALVWGVRDTALGTSAEQQVRQDWSVRYLVRTGVSAEGRAVRRLVRQLVDTASVVRGERVLLEGLRTGSGATPGFRVVQSGAVWEIDLATTGEGEGEAGFEVELHVQTRN